MTLVRLNYKKSQIIQKKNDRKQITNIRNERGNINIDSTKTKKIIMEFYEQFYFNNFDNRDEMEKFLERYKIQVYPRKKCKV